MATCTPNHRLLKIHRSYTVEEVASVLGVHRNSVRNWMRSGLDAIDHRRPTLILGSVLASFLKARRQGRKRPCGRGELFCLRCRSPRPPVGNAVSYIPRTPTFGECVGYVLNEDDRLLLPTTLAQCSRGDAYALASEILNFGFNQEIGPARRTSLAALMEVAASRAVPVDPAQLDTWIDADWDEWDTQQRLRGVEEIYGGSAWFSPGVKLSKMRSPVVEAWLAKASEARSEDGA